MGGGALIELQLPRNRLYRLSSEVLERHRSDSEPNRGLVRVFRKRTQVHICLFVIKERESLKSRETAGLRILLLFSVSRSRIESFGEREITAWNVLSSTLKYKKKENKERRFLNRRKEKEQFFFFKKRKLGIFKGI